MKIVVASSLTLIATANYLIGALRRAGHELLVVSDVPSANADIVSVGGPDLAAVCAQRQFRPDLALFIEGGTMSLFPRGLESLDCPTAWYGIDTHMNYAGHARLARLFDVSFICHRQFVESIAQDAGRPTHWLPVACARELLPTPGEARPVDVAFVGGLDARMFPKRARILEIARQVARTTEFGAASPAEMMQRYARAKIVVNCSVNNDLNMRYFEAMGAGAVLLTDPVVGGGAEELFEAGRHYLVYRSEDEFIAQMKSVLASPEVVRAIGTAARREIEARHTYDHRVQALVAALAGVRKQVRPHPADYFAAFTVLNMVSPALRAAGDTLAETGARTRWRPVNRTLGATLHAAAACGATLSRIRSAWRRLRRRQGR